MADRTIVIVDDEEELRENLRDLLEFHEYIVHVFSNAETFLDKIDAIPVDLVLMDYLLPTLNGLEAIRRLKAQKPDIPAALVTASSQQVIIEEAQRIGVDRIIYKPYSHREILQAVETLLSSK
ncbi:MAG: response regulator [Candidatus Omnitrophota bacterium]|jgi:DNA-binding NarL/FixJ family response regulator|nr:MAG: response regulator [Candidatus Omnitrophota bacterium]